MGLYGQANGAQDATNMNSYNTPTNVFQLTLGQDAVIRKKTTYYLFNKDQPPVIATKKNILQVFSKKQTGGHKVY